MVNERSAEWKKLNRELKILRARKAASGRLTVKDEERLKFLEQTLGEAEAAKRVLVEEETSVGPKRTTADGAFATEVAEDLLKQADGFEAQKAWDQDVSREPKAKEVEDSREGKATFKQKGLSPFAIDLSSDLQGLGLSEEQPAEEEEQPHQVGMKRSFQVAFEDETPVAGSAAAERPASAPANPFAIQLDDGLAATLEAAPEPSSLVPDTAARSHQIDVGREEEDEDIPTRAADIDPQLQAMLQQAERSASAGEDLSRGARTSFEVQATTEETALDDHLLAQAMQDAQQKGLVDETTESWAVDDAGNEIETGQEADEGEESTQIGPSAFDLPPTGPPAEEPPVAVPLRAARPRPSFAEGTTTPGAEAEAAPAQGGFAGGVTSPTVALVPEPTLANVPVETQIREDDLPPGTEVPDISDASMEAVPDISDAAEAELDMFVEAEEEPPEPRRAAESDYDYDKAMHDDLAAVPEFEVEDPSLVKPPPAGASELDSFWGLAEEAPAPTLAQPAPPPPAPRPAAKPPPAPRPAAADPPFPDLEVPPPPPGARTGGARPLPALNLQAARVAVQPPAPRPKPAPPPPARTARPAPAAPPSDQARGILNDLFEEDAPAAVEPTRAQPTARPSQTAQPDRTTARPASAGGQGAVRRPVASGRPAPAAKGGRPNNLRGPRKATVHFKDGASKRGSVPELDLNADWIRLDPSVAGEAGAEELNALALKAIFLMLPPGLAYPEKSGSPVKLRMIDGRQLEGFCPDYSPTQKAFTLFPKVDQGNIERILVFNDAVKNVWFLEEG